MDLGELVKKYIALRDKKAALAAEYKAKTDKIDTVLDAAERAILAEFNDTGISSAKTDSGTAYKVIRTSAKVADANSFFDFVAQDFVNNRSFLENRVSKSAVEQYIEDHGGDLPPGVTVSRFATINIKRG